MEEIVELLVEDIVEDIVELIVEDIVELIVEDIVELIVEDGVEDIVELIVEDRVEDIVEDFVELMVEDGVEDLVELIVDDGVDGIIGFGGRSAPWISLVSESDPSIKTTSTNNRDRQWSSSIIQSAPNPKQQIVVLHCSKVNRITIVTDNVLQLFIKRITVWFATLH